MRACAVLSAVEVWWYSDGISEDLELKQEGGVEGEL